MNDGEGTTGPNRPTDIARAAPSRALCDLVLRTAATHGDAPALSVRGPGTEWTVLTWTDVRDEVLRTAAGLVEIGVRPGDRVAIMASDRPERVLAGLGIVRAGAVPVAVRSALASHQLASVAGASGAVVAIVESGDELRRWIGVLPSLGKLLRLVVLEPPPSRPRSVLTWNRLTEIGALRLAAAPGADRAENPHPTGSAP